jgi:hypothetical protein
MNAAAEGHHAVGVFKPKPTGPSQAASVLLSDTQLMYFLLAQDQANVIFEGITQGEAHQCAKRLVANTDWQKTAWLNNWPWRLRPAPISSWSMVLMGTSSVSLIRWISMRSFDKKVLGESDRKRLPWLTYDPPIAS